MRWASLPRLSLPRLRAGRHRGRRARLVGALIAGAATLAAAAVTVPMLTAGGSPPAGTAGAPAGLGRGADQPAAHRSPSPSPEPAEVALGAPAPEVVRAAIEFSPLVRYHPDLPGDAYTNAGNTGGHTYILAFAARAGDTSVDGRLLEQIRYSLTGGNDIAANGGYPAQHELQVTGMLSVAKRIPRIWDQLSDAERARADATMTASLVGNGFTTSDANPFVAGGQQYTLDGDDNIDRDWNPNYREGMVGSVLVATAYFGVAEAADRLANYDHDAFVAELDSLGLANAHRTFTWRAAHPDSPAPTGDQIEAAVRDWSLRGATIDQPMRLFADLTAHTYGRTEGTVVECGYEGGEGLPDSGAPGGVAGVIDSGCDGLPNRGSPGQLLEFASVDAGGVRSSAGYAYGGFKPNLFTRTVLMDAGLWDPNRKQTKIFDLALVGAEDLWYKLDHGYRDYEHGGYRETVHIDDAGWGFAFLRSLWDDVFRNGAAG